MVYTSGANGEIWGAWNVSTAYYATTTLSSATTNTMVAATWNYWNQVYTATTCGSNSVNYVDWPVWNRRLSETREQQTARVQAEAERQREANARAAKRLAEQSEVRKRAERLLADCLTKQQQRDLEKKQCFYLDVVSPDGKINHYRIDRGTHGNVKRIDGEGRILESLCIQPDGVPVEDAMAAQKLWLESNELEFRRMANITRVAGP
jgi:hypothetical protein